MTYHPFVKDCPKRAMFNGRPVCGCGELPTNLPGGSFAKDVGGHATKRGDEIKFEDGRVARVLKVKSGTIIDIVYRKACDVHPGYWTYYRFAWWWHVFWRHIIGF